MDTADLIRMANQIADYFSAYTHAEAVDGIADHIQKFWDPRMRRGLLAHVEAGGAELDPLVIEASRHLTVPAAG